MRLLKPDLILNSVFDIDINHLKDRNIKGIIFDIDNTLASNKEETPKEEILDFLKRLKENGFKIGISSNGNKERVTNYTKGLDFIYEYKANKPIGIKTMKIVNKFGLDKSNVCLVGDQIFTDVLGGNFLGLYTILVTPIDNYENKFIKVKRLLEKFILKNSKGESNEKNSDY